MKILFVTGFNIVLVETCANSVLKIEVVKMAPNWHPESWKIVKKWDRGKIKMSLTPLRLATFVISVCCGVIQAGKTTNEPIDKFNHGIDAVRYVCLAKVMVNRKRMVKVGRV